MPAATSDHRGDVCSSGIWGNVIMAVILPIFGLFFCGIAYGHARGNTPPLVYLHFLAGTFAHRSRDRASIAFVRE